MITLDASDSTPPYEQVRARVVELVDDGTLAPGDRLPTVRSLAAELGIATNTVARAFRELEQAGVVETRGRAGTFVTGSGADRAAKQAAVDFLDRTAALGLTGEQAVDLVRHLVEHPVRSS